MSSTSASLVSKLDGLRPELVTRISLVLARMEANGTPMKITDAFRTTGQQVQLYRQGRFGDPRPRVTPLDGIHQRSRHQDGEAVDCCFLGPQPYAESHPWGFYGDQVRTVGLVWGGDFTHPDRPHCELPEDSA